MKIGFVILGWTLAGVASAQIGVRLPTLPLPSALSNPHLGGSSAGLDAEPKVAELRKLAVRRLLRDNPRTLENDAHGAAIVRQEVMTVSPSEESLRIAARLGFTVAREWTYGALPLRVIVLAIPAATSTSRALRELRRADPGGTYDFNHVYSSSASPRPTPIAAAPPAPREAGQSTRTRVGLIDSGVDASHPVFAHSGLHARGCAPPAVPAGHATAVASLLVNSGATDLYAADVFCGVPSGGSVERIAAALAWLVEAHVAVINVSLVGPDNRALASVVAALTQRGYLIVAAVGNDGPASPPLYPAAYPRVIGVTAVDRAHHALLEAVRGPQVMFAALGADIVAADSQGGMSAVRGTSFAAPLVAALLAGQVSEPGVEAADAAIAWLAGQAIDLGAPGRDTTYGFGLVGSAAR